VCLRSLALCAYEFSRRTRIFPQICIQQQNANFESAENVRSSNVVKFKLKLFHISNIDTTQQLTFHIMYSNILLIITQPQPSKIIW